MSSRKNFARPLAALALLFAAANVTAAPVKANRAAPGDPAAEKAMADPTGPTTLTPTATVTYSGNIAASPTFNRALADCTGLSGVGTAVGYQAQAFTVDISGSYTLTMTVFADDGFFLLYSPSFNPAAGTTNCIAGSDDAVGDDPQITTNLTAGTSYVLVSTTFANGVTGTFTNTITGPGTATFPPSSDLVAAISAPGGVPTSGAFTYNVGVQNDGPDPATGVAMSIVLGTGVTFTGSNCGATAAGSTVTWNVGNMPNGAIATCTLNVATAGPCAAVTTTATVTSTSLEGDPSNNTASTSNSSTPVADGSFEAGTPSPSWTEVSDVFGTPLYEDATLARTGDWLSYFGCSNPNCAPTNEYVEQAVVIPANATLLSYYIDACGTDGNFQVLIDSVVRDTLAADGSPCTDFDNGTPTHVLRTIDLVAAGVANGASHTIRFAGTTSNAAVDGGFLVDDISIAAPPVCTAPAAADLALSQTNTAVSPVQVGTSFTKTLTVTNNGPGAVTSFTVVDTLPAQLTFAGSTCGATAAGQVVTWTGGAVPFPGSASCTITVTVAAAGTFTNTAAITASSPADPTPGNNTSTSGTITGAPAGLPFVPTSVPLGSKSGFALLAGLLALVGWMAVRRRTA